ncbi:MAG: 16S rRNA (cytosine(1402)-N(4))-methyltransferase RsmH [bacterium]|nr:16S rRNA (cytosine(1402)-N(4))-methyltransferase RsmH [bacterium]
MQKHKPVLLDQVIEVLHPGSGEKFIDMTAGYGGHSKKLLSMIGSDGYGYLIDRDKQAIDKLKKSFKSAANVQIIKNRFSQIDKLGLPKVDMILIDLGVSSAQLDEANRGFSFLKEARLDMRMDRSDRLDAHYVVNNYSQKDLANLIFHYGEEKKARQIAKSIVESRKVRTIETTIQLANIIAGKIRKTGKINPATKTFQAIRIEVNNELDELKKGLENSLKFLGKGGRLAVISFHSLEDRIVKRFIDENSKETTDITGKVIAQAYLKKVTKKPITGKLESDYNRRARSAKLRAAVKIK